MLSHITKGRVQDWKESFIDSNISESENKEEKSINSKIITDQNNDQLTNLIRLAHFIVKKTREFAPISNNIGPGKDTVCGDIFEGLTRIRGNNDYDKKLIKDVLNSPLDLTIQRTDLLSFPSLNKTMSYISIWQKVCWNLPKNTGKNMTDQEWIESVAIKALKFGAGNCGAVSAIAFLLFLEYANNITHIKINQKIRVLRVLLDEEDHTWNILNLNENVSLQDFSSWNDDTLFCDAWSRQVFTKKELLAYVTKEEAEIVAKVFSNIRLGKPGDGFYVGEVHNKKPIHTNRWQTKHSSTSYHKFWRPLRLMDAQKPNTPKLNQPIRQQIS